jgi:hypothetical protein
MYESYIILALAIGVPIVAFAVTPYIAKRALQSKAQPKVNAQCYECLETFDSDCAAACRLPA